MSPASKSKSKDKRAVAKDSQKSLVKPAPNASCYNPLLGTFHTLDTAPVSTAPSLHINGRSRTFDDSEEHNGYSVIGVEYDSLSNNGSWSGESEDHKDKISQVSTRNETAPSVDNDKREKIRQKNEKKHQRQKERRAQELHERCSGYLMSRKLESLAQQLVAMGFSSERATMALILNEGKVEQSVAWLFEGGEDPNNHQEDNNNNSNAYGGGNLKIDISEELARITEMEVKFKCSKQEVERAIVACEGDLHQAAETLKETLKVQKQEEPPAALPKLEETNGKISTTARSVSKAIPIQQKTNDKDLNYNYAKSGLTVGPTSTDPGIKTVQLLKKASPNPDWNKHQQVGTPFVEKRWPATVGGSNGPNSNPSVSHSLTSPSQAKIEPRYSNIGSELKSLQLGSVREPVIVMQRPKSKNPQSSVTSSLSASVPDWHPNVLESNSNNSSYSNSNSSNYSNPNGFSHGPTSTRSFNSSSFHYQPQQHQPLPQQHYASSTGPFDPFDHFNQQGSMTHFNNGGIWNNRTVGSNTNTNTIPPLAAASSLGLFSGLGLNGLSGPSGPSSSVDWNACDSLQFDYTNIDWSLDRLSLPPSSPSRHNSMWVGSGQGGGRTTPTPMTATRPPVGLLSNGTNRLSMGLGSDGVGQVGSEASAGGSREWTSAFEEKELFIFPRQFVSSPSL